VSGELCVSASPGGAYQLASECSRTIRCIHGFPLFANGATLLGLQLRW
jgi:hypothetical protein